VFSGTNGFQLVWVTNHAPATTKATSTAIFRITIALLARADSRVPISSSQQVNSTIRIAGRFTTPGSSPKGGLISALGRSTPALANVVPT